MQRVLHHTNRLQLELHEAHTTYTKVWRLHEPPVVKQSSSNRDDNDVSDDVSGDGDTPLSTTVSNGHTLHTMPTPPSYVDQWNEHRVGGISWRGCHCLQQTVQLSAAQ
jgi:hypothetical protein